MDGEEDDLSLLAALLEENETALDCNPEDSHPLTQGNGEPDTYDELFDADGDGESYSEEAADGDLGETEELKENLATLFGDMGDLTDEEVPTQQSPKNRVLPASVPNQGKTNQELQDELRKLQEQMKSLQEQLKMASLKQPASPPLLPKSVEKSPRSPLKEKKVQRIQESSCFSAELDVPALPKTKRVARTPKISPAESKSTSSKMTSTPPQPLRTTPGNKPSGLARDQSTGTPRSSGEPAQTVVSMEAFSGLRLRRPRVSSTEMNKKMVGRKLIRLSQLKEKMASEQLEEVDWVTFGVILKKITPQSSNSGKTFSIWRLNDLRDLTRCVSLFLFGEVHKELWKTEQGTVIGLLNANPMKPKDGSEEVCLSIDHPQKVLIMGEALDLGTCKAKKKNGQPCTQTVNLNDCEYCQYHIQAQYKKLSARRADLQSTFSGGRIPKKFGARKGTSLRERLCQDGFYYGGISSASYAASMAAAVAPKKKIQTTLTDLVVKGADLIIQETQQKLGIHQKSLSCSEEFRELMDLPTFGARNLKQHLAKTRLPGVMGGSKPAFQSVSASALLKQQKQHMLEMRKKRSEEIQKRFLQSSSGVKSPAVPSSSQGAPSQSLQMGAVLPILEGTPATQMPKLGRGISEGDDVLFFDESPPPRPKLSASAEAKKLAAITKLRAKGQILTKTDPNSIKKKQKDPQDVLEVKERVEKNTFSPQAEDELEPARKKRREQLAYMESEEFQKILKAKSKHTGILKEAEAELQERYFEPLVKKEQMEEKMRSIREVKCRVVTCKTCAYTHFKPLETCVSEQHDYHWHDGLKRFFKCPCGNRSISLDRLPKKHCSNCGLFKWERDGMLKEKTGPKIGGETLLPRGEEHAKFLNSLK
ncbi:protein MCM10 homolog [Meles meles]|uniref:protein MCM10 homolog n=1 Tax=Meles meles TaxID=9662 RepID=UPI001E69FD47|nr:protein MCM10 homolog [Meles meles]